MPDKKESKGKASKKKPAENKKVVKKRVPLASLPKEPKKGSKSTLASPDVSLLEPVKKKGSNPVSLAKNKKSSKRVSLGLAKKGGNVSLEGEKTLTSQSTESNKNQGEKKEKVAYRKITDEQLEHAIMQYRGIVSAICQQYKMTRSAVWKRINKSDHLREVYKDARELIKDEIESEFVKAVRRGEKWAIEKGIDKLLYDRGYVSKQDINQNVKQDEEQFRKTVASDGNAVMNIVKSIRKTLRSDAR